MPDLTKDDLLRLIREHNVLKDKLARYERVIEAARALRKRPAGWGRTRETWTREATELFDSVDALDAEDGQ